MCYVQLVHLFLLFSRACKTNDVDLFLHGLGHMLPVFFAGNRPNYARWMVRYHLNLVNMDKTHPGVQRVLENGALSVRRTKKTFSRTPVDMTLEQTVNADAASRLTGVGSFTQSESARKRWMVTRSVRSSMWETYYQRHRLRHLMIRQKSYNQTGFGRTTKTHLVLLPASRIR